jgi:lactate 2-monooxygenase
MDFQILGPIQVRRDGKELPIGGAKRRAVLAILLLHANEVVTVDRICQDLWGDEQPHDAIGAVQSHVSRLRKLFGADVVTTHPGGYSLDLQTHEFDLHRFERLTADAEAATPVRRSGLLHEALELWRGPPLADLASEPFAVDEANRLEEARLAVLEDRLDADLALGRHHDLVGELKRLVSANPLRERLRGQLIVALYRSGRQAEALDVYRDARSVLAEELGLEPGPALKKLERDILQQDPTLAAPLYLSGVSPWPVRAEDWETRARQALEAGPFGYIAGGAGGEETLRANYAAFESLRLRPKMLHRIDDVDLSVEVLGTRSRLPFFLAPIGLQSVAHDDASLGSATAAARLGVPYCASTVTSHTIEEIAVAVGDAPLWFQLYWLRDREITASLIARAERAGCSAIVLTVDTPVVGWRPRDLENEYVPYGAGVAQLTSDPVFRSRLDVPPEDDPENAQFAALAMFSSFHMAWDDFAWLRRQTALPILIKGILRGDDARRALAEGADGIIVSNHGGRQVDGAVSSLHALREVRLTVGNDAVVLVDGGIRRAADVIKGLAAGADAVLIGRQYVYALAVGGRDGVETLIRQLEAELEVSLRLIGCARVQELDSSWLDNVGLTGVRG